MRIAHVVASLEMRHGGPSRSVRELAGASARCGHAVDLLTSAPVARPDETHGSLRIRTWRRGAPQSICPVPEMPAVLALGAYEIVHEHGLWLRPLHYAHRAAVRDRIPFVVSPRGMMAPWAWRHHRLRKALAARFVHPGALKNVTGWHATSAEERDDIAALGFRQPVCVAPNGVNAPATSDIAAAREHWRHALSETPERRVALFHSRLHEKKRVLELIDLWASVAPQDWMLLIVGVPEQYSVAQLRAYVQRAGAGNIEVFDGTNTPPPYAVASLFVLPSHNENFGLVIAEAMAHGVPVLVTDTTPWREVAQHGAGWCVAWSSFADTLRIATGESVETLQRRGLAAQSWVLRDFSWEESAHTLIDFYRSLSSA